MVEAASQNLRVDLRAGLRADLRSDFRVGGTAADLGAESPGVEFPAVESLAIESWCGEGKDLTRDYGARRARRLLPDAVEHNDAQVGPAAASEIDREDSHAA